MSHHLIKPENAIADHYVVISLAPLIYHADISRAVIRRKTHVVTTSHISPAMKKLGSPAKDAGTTIPNEVGIDLGIDYLYAIKVIGESTRKAER